jgi:hypothetical protein
MMSNRQQGVLDVLFVVGVLDEVVLDGVLVVLEVGTSYEVYIIYVYFYMFWYI